MPNTFGHPVNCAIVFCCLFTILSVTTRTALAQSDSSPAFRETPPTPGLVKGYMKSGDRWGALLNGGRTVYPNDTFTVTTRGQKYSWKVLNVSNGAVRLASAPASPIPDFAAPADCSPNFAGLVSLLEKGARAYKEASTRVRKDLVMTTLRDEANAWCSTNAILCVKARLADIRMTDDSTAQIRLQDVDCGSIKPVNPNLYIHKTYMITIPVTRQRAMSFKCGDSVILCGRPAFHPSADNIFGDGSASLTSFTLFKMLTDSRTIGSLELQNPRYDIYDPTTDKVQ